MVRYSNKCQVTSVDIFYTNTKNFPLSLAFTFASPLSNHQQYRTQRPKRGRVQKKKQQTIFKPNTDRTYAQEQIHFMLTFGNFTTYTLLCCLFFSAIKCLLALFFLFRFGKYIKSSDWFVCVCFILRALYGFCILKILCAPEYFWPF